MEKVCLVEAGKYCVALASGCIESIVPVEDFQHDREQLLHLGSFFEQARCADEASGTVLQMTANSGLPDLLVDRMVVEIDCPPRFEPLPQLYPEKAKQCCPQIFIYANEPVMLLDSEGLSKKLQQMGYEFSFARSIENSVFSDDEQAGSEESLPVGEDVANNPDQVDAAVIEDLRAVLGEDGESVFEIVGKNDLNEHDSGRESFISSPFDGVYQGDEDEAEDEKLVSPDEIEQEIVLKNDLSEGEFARVVCWTIQAYLQWDSPAAILLEPADIPGDVVSGVQETVLEGVIAKTLDKCRESSPEMLEAIMIGLEKQSALV